MSFWKDLTMFYRPETYTKPFTGGATDAQDKMAEYEKSRIDAQRSMEEDQLSAEQTTARKIYAKRMGSLRSQLAQSGSVLDVGSAGMLQEEEIEAQAEQESVAMGSWFDRQQTLGEAKEMVDYKTKVAKGAIESQATSQLITAVAGIALAPVTGGASLAGTAVAVGGLLQGSGTSNVSVPIGQRRAGYKQWLAGGL